MQISLLVLTLVFAIAESLALSIPKEFMPYEGPNDFTSLRFHGFHHEADTCDFSELMTSFPEHIKFIMASPEWKECHESKAEKMEHPNKPKFSQGIENSTPNKMEEATQNLNSSDLSDLGVLNNTAETEIRDALYEQSDSETDLDSLHSEATVNVGALDLEKGFWSDHSGIDLYFGQIQDKLRSCQISGEIDLECYTPIKRLVLGITKQYDASEFSPKASRKFAGHLRDLYDQMWPMDLEAADHCLTTAIFDKNCIFFSADEYAEEVEELYTTAENFMIDVLYHTGSLDVFEGRVASLKARLGTLELIELTELSNETDIGDIDQMVEEISVMIKESEKFLRQRFDPGRNEASEGFGDDTGDDIGEGIGEGIAGVEPSGTPESFFD